VLLKDNLAETTSYMGYRNVLKQQFYKGIGIDHTAGRRLYLFHGLSHLGIIRMQHFGSPYALPNQLIQSSTGQFQYYVQGRYYPGDDWSLRASVTLVTGEAASDYYTFNQSGLPSLNGYVYPIGDYVLSAGVSREYRLLKPSLSMAFGNVNDFRQIQTDAQILFYPLGNPDIYLISGLTAHNDDSFSSLKYVYNQQVGVRTGPVWITGSGSVGTIRNFSASDGYVLYNMPENITGMYGLAVYIPMADYRFGVTLRYQMLEKAGTTFDYSTPLVYQRIPYTFRENNFLISLKWNL
jgi:hypothetical protein